MHSNRHVAPKVQRNLVRSRATAKQLSCTRTHTLLCGHCVLFCTRGGWLAATGAMSTPRARKKAKTSAERRLETLQGCHTNKFADIDFSKFQLRRAAAGDPMQVVPVKARSDALVQDWRDVGSYEPSGAPGYTTEQFMALCDDSTLRQHYTGPFGCKVQMSMPEPGGALCKAGKLVQGRSALQKLQKQLGVMCLRNIMGHFLGKDSAAISTEELQDANTAAHAVGGAGAMLTADEAAAWAPPAYPLFGDGLLLGGTLARQKQTLDSRTLELLRGEGAVVDKLSSGASGGAAFLAAFGVLRQVINGTTCVTQLTAGSLRIAWARVAFQIAHWHPTPVALVLVVHWVTPCCALGTQLAKCKTQHRLCLQCRANWLSPPQMQNKFCTVKKMCGTGFVLCSIHCIWYVQFHVQCTRSTLHKVQCIR